MDTFFSQTGTATSRQTDNSAQTSMQVRKRNGTLEPVAVSDLKDDIYATPAISDDRIYVRTRGWLYCFGLARR